MAQDNDVRYCPYCGKPGRSDDVYCHNCGKKILRDTPNDSRAENVSAGAQPAQASAAKTPAPVNVSSHAAPAAAGPGPALVRPAPSPVRAQAYPSYQAPQSMPPARRRRGGSIFLIILVFAIATGGALAYQYSRGGWPFEIKPSHSVPVSGQTVQVSPDVPDDPVDLTDTDDAVFDAMSQEEHYQEALRLINEEEYMDALVHLSVIRGYRDTDSLIKQYVFVGLDHILVENFLSNEMAETRSVLDEESREFTQTVRIYDEYAQELVKYKPSDWDALGESMCELCQMEMKLLDLLGFTEENSYHVKITFENYESGKVYIRIRDGVLTYSLYAN